ncbi:MAG: LytS/YehU family sensor histidine kinase [Neolewinella sp.]|jgi:LytS/YehU family sensor histidine kinase
MLQPFTGTPSGWPSPGQLKDRCEVKHQLQVFKEENLKTELKLLKSQIHPHFLFNTLNNLYALTLQKSDRAPEVVAKLSELLSFLLYEGGKPTVPVNKEIELLQNYIDLKILRYGKSLQLSFSHEVDNAKTNCAAHPDWTGRKCF